MSGFDMAPPAALLPNAAAAVAVWKVRIKFMLSFWSAAWDHPHHSWNVPQYVTLGAGQVFSLFLVELILALRLVSKDFVDLMAVWSTTCNARSGDDSAGYKTCSAGLCWWSAPTANEQSVATFFSHVMSAIGGNTAGPGDAVVNVYINHEKKFAFVEMRSVEEASNAMALDGIIFEIRELLESFGPLRGFDLVKDRETGNSKGYAFCVYQDLSVTDIACAALNGIKMGDKTLTVRRANQGASQPKPEQESVLLHAQQQIALQRLMLAPNMAPATKVVCLTQVVTAEELKDDDDYEDIVEDMRTECGKFGTLVNVIIPRPLPSGEMPPGVGKVFLEYADTESATKARQGLNGRKFGGNEVVAVFYPENKFSEGDYSG
ncbi:UNVERIFIED_CONTAM: Splicing factor U2af large subunit B [Sesamum radiatum]|uniref:Splicing factor U2af large subunit B n=1 Tax=Sesamum radiatum TaxID=300843 RepID=A0AAW2JXS3_SESRA